MSVGFAPRFVSHPQGYYGTLTTTGSLANTTGPGIVGSSGSALAAGPDITSSIAVNPGMQGVSLPTMIVPTAGISLAQSLRQATPVLLGVGSAGTAFALALAASATYAFVSAGSPELVSALTVAGPMVVFEGNATPATSAEVDDAALYAELFELVDEMGRRPPGMELAIHRDTALEAIHFLSMMSLYDVPPPKVFSPSPDAIVFTWKRPALSRYATYVDGELHVVDIDRRTSTQTEWEPRKTVGSDALELIVRLGGKVRSSSSAIAA